MDMDGKTLEEMFKKKIRTCQVWWHIPLTHDRSLHVAVLREVPHVLQEHWPGLVWGPQGEDFVALRVRDSQAYHPTTGKPPTEFPWYQQAYPRMLESRGRRVLYGAPPKPYHLIPGCSAQEPWL